MVAAVLPTSEAIGRLRPIGSEDVRLTNGFWADRLATNRERTIPAGFGQLDRAGNFHNLRLAAGSVAAGDGYRALGLMFDKPFPFLDSDVYKWLEAAGWELGRQDDPAIRSMADEAIRAVEAAQRPDGYLNTFVQVIAPGTEYADLEWGHELYCVGHLIQAAIAWHRALGDERLLLVADRAASSVERALGPDGREAIEGHPEIEMALVELYRTTGERRYLDLAATLIDRRGRGLLTTGRFGQGYWQDHLPVREAPSVVGHAVRQLYLDCGAVDVAVELGDEQLLDAVMTRWRDMVATRMYLTGALGSRHRDEAFGDPFELPPDQAYAETCAAIASVMLAWRLLLATGEPECADVIERTILNGVLPSLSLEGTAFFYVNPLQRRTDRAWVEPGTGERASWYACACCPPNIMRLLGAWPQLLATTDDSGMQVHQYASAEIAGRIGQEGVSLAIETDYPWSGRVRVTVTETPERPWTLTLRLPGWCRAARVAEPGAAGRPVQDAAGAVNLTRSWRVGESVDLDLDMTVRVTEPHPRIDAVRSCVALERGPIVYCLESADLPSGTTLEDVALVADGSVESAPRPELGPSIVGLAATGLVDGTAVAIDAVPYFAWSNRTPAGMRVWVPRADPVEGVKS